MSRTACRGHGAGFGRSAVAVAMLVAATLLGGCATTTTSRSMSGAEEQLRDRVTASDEPDAQRRARTRMELASAYFGRGQMATALDQVKIAIAADPNYAQAFNLRGLIYANLGETALAEESFRRALQLSPRDADAMHNFGFYLCQQRRYPEAYAQFAQALAMPQYQGAGRTLLTQGVCQAHAGQLEAAEASLARAYEIDPANPFAATNLAEVLYRRGEFERARFYVRRVNAMDGVSNAQTLWLATRIEQRLGNAQGVSDFGRQLRNRFPDSREAAAFSRGSFDD